jgi:hypothetical protein
MEDGGELVGIGPAEERVARCGRPRPTTKPVTPFVTRTRVGWSGFLLLMWFRLKLSSLVGGQWGVSEFSHNPSGRGFEPHPPHRLCG